MLVVCPHCQKTNRVPSDKPADQALCGSCGQALFTGLPVEMDFVQLQKNISRTEIPLLVDFWAPWCAPCRMMAPAFAEAAAQLSPNIILAKVDTEAHQQAGAAFDIRSIPTMVLFVGGQEKARVSGAMNTSQIKAWFNQALAN
jgi:thioredoxin 2